MRDVAQHFMRSGYARLPQPIDEILLARLRAVVDRLFDEGEDPVRLNAVGQIARVDGLLDRDDVFRDVLTSQPVSDGLRALLGPDVEVERFRHNHATRLRAGEVPLRLHRDAQHWSRPIVSVFVYLEDAAVENGCTHVVPASHDLPYAGPQAGGGGGTWADEYEHFHHLLDQALPVPMRAGGVLFVHGLAFHSVGVNRTSGTRTSIVFACRSVDHLRPDADDSSAVVLGSRTFLGNSATPESGSLKLRTPWTTTR